MAAGSEARMTEVDPSAAILQDPPDELRALMDDAVEMGEVEEPGLGDVDPDAVLMVGDEVVSLPEADDERLRSTLDGGSHVIGGGEFPGP
jgi:hypothetical protein